MRMCALSAKWLLVCVVVILSGSCSTKRKLQDLANSGVTAGISPSNVIQMEKISDTLLDRAPKERIVVTDMLGEVYYMDAVKDEELGEMVISDRLDAVVVEAKFRNVAERNGYVDIAFDVMVPKSLQNREWQVRMIPYLCYLGDTLQLDKVYITGEKYRNMQIRGYELYEKFLSSIIPEDSDFVDNFTWRNLLELFIQRNFKDIAMLKSDSSYVGQGVEESLFGVTVREAIEHYTKETLVRRNNRRIANKERMFAKYVKAPIENRGIRLDSVIVNPDSSVVYHYTHTVRAVKDLRRIDLYLTGEIWNTGQLLYEMPDSETITFYISSMTFFADNTPRYVKRIVSRNAVVNNVANIGFRLGEYRICDTLGNNIFELERIKSNIANIFSDPTYQIDSLTITAFCSPEGAYRVNETLALRRAASVKDYFYGYVQSVRDSISNIYWELSVGDDGETLSGSGRSVDIAVNTGYVAEDWDMLRLLLARDTIIMDKGLVEECLAEKDPDKREYMLRKSACYTHIRDELYPKLRRVKFDFFMHRKGMLKDTIHTTELDTLYMNGLAALQNRDYKRAVTLLRPYGDINSAVAYICMDYNSSALELLERLPDGAHKEYMLSVVHSRLGNEELAVGHFINSVKLDPSMRHRGNLDPEIYHLIRRYNVAEILENN